MDSLALNEPADSSNVDWNMKCVSIKYSPNKLRRYSREFKEYRLEIATRSEFLTVTTTTNRNKAMTPDLLKRDFSPAKPVDMQTPCYCLVP
jgi:hypothetical protein